MIFHDIEQNSDEWDELRLGKITGSELGKIMANYGKAFGQPAHDYALKIALERVTGVNDGSSFTNAHMDRGHAQEPIARALYEEEFFCDVLPGGFYDLGEIGCSPDGRVGEDGIIEIKSVISKVHYANVKRADIDPSYKWQIAGNLMFTGRKWIDFVSYCSSYPSGKKLFVVRKTPSDLEECFNMIDLRIAEFMALIDQKRNDILM